MSYPQVSAFIKLATGEYPRREGDIRREHPEIPESATWPNFPCPDTFAVVPWEPAPEHDRATHCAIEKQPLLIDGQWKIQWEVRPYTQEELEQLAAMASINNRDFEAPSEGSAIPPVEEITVVDLTILNP